MIKLKEDAIEIQSELIPWSQIKTIRLLNNKLAFQFKSGLVKEIEIEKLHPLLIDQIFRTFEQYLRANPTKKN